MSDKKLERSGRFRFVDFLIIVVFLSIAAVFVYLLADDLTYTFNSREAYLSDLSLKKAPPAVAIPPEVPQISIASAAVKPVAEEPMHEEPPAKEPTPVETPTPAPQVSPPPVAAPSRPTARSSSSSTAASSQPAMRSSSPQAAAPPPLLPSPRNMQPARGTDFSLEELRAGENITFSWTAVQGANAYIFYLYRQTASGQPQVIRTNLVYAPSYTMTNPGVLSSGTFIWKIEAVYIGRGNVIERSGTQGESSFVVE